MRSFSEIMGGRRPAAREEIAAGITGTRAESIYRLQVGLSGLAAVLLMIALASVIMDRANRTEAASLPEAAATVAPTPVQTEQNDPLAEVGVMPDMPATPTPDATPAPPPAMVPGQGNAPQTE
jgi:hypothetical protein